MSQQDPVEMHSSLRKAIEFPGLGSDALRRNPVNASFEIECAELRRAIAKDRESGLQPCCIIGNARTVKTGAINDLGELAEICRDERADSRAFDLHKWMSVPYGAGCVMVRDADLHHRAFSTPSACLAYAERGLSGGDSKAQ